MTGAWRVAGGGGVLEWWEAAPAERSHARPGLVPGGSGSWRITKTNRARREPRR